jgi:molybdopterin converting factor small subunit
MGSSAAVPKPEPLLTGRVALHAEGDGPRAAGEGAPRFPAAAEGGPGAAVQVVHVELFGTARIATGAKRVALPYAEAGCLADVVGALAVRFRELVGPVIREGGRGLQEGFVFNVNGRDFVPDLRRPLAPGDSVLLIAAAAGG